MVKELARHGSRHKSALLKVAILGFGPTAIKWEACIVMRGHIAALEDCIRKLKNAEHGPMLNSICREYKETLFTLRGNSFIRARRYFSLARRILLADVVPVAWA